MTYEVEFSEEAKEDLRRLEDYLLERALEEGDFDFVVRRMGEIRGHIQFLGRNPFTCRMVDGNPFERELVIPFGRTGYVALFKVVSENQVLLTAIRHQREDGYH